MGVDFILDYFAVATGHLVPFDRSWFFAPQRQVSEASARGSPPQHEAMLDHHAVSTPWAPTVRGSATALPNPVTAPWQGVVDLSSTADPV